MVNPSDTPIMPSYWGFDMPALDPKNVYDSERYRAFIAEVMEKLPWRDASEEAAAATEVDALSIAAADAEQTAALEVIEASGTASLATTLIPGYEVTHDTNVKPAPVMTPANELVGFGETARRPADETPLKKLDDAAALTNTVQEKKGAPPSVERIVISTLTGCSPIPTNPDHCDQFKRFRTPYTDHMGQQKVMNDFAYIAQKYFTDIMVTEWE